MCQEKSLKTLERNRGRWMTAKEVAKKIGITAGTCAVNLSRLFKQKYVNRRIIKRNAHRAYIYQVR